MVQEAWFPKGHFEEGQSVRLREPEEHPAFDNPRGVLTVMAKHWFNLYQPPTYLLREADGCITVGGFHDEDLLPVPVVVEQSARADNSPAPGSTGGALTVYAGEALRTIHQGWYWAKRGASMPPAAIFVAVTKNSTVLDFGHRCELYIQHDGRESDDYEGVVLMGPIIPPEFPRELA